MPIDANPSVNATTGDPSSATWDPADTCSSPKNVLVRTLPPSTGNYGGILQAWALQQALKSLGHLPVLDESVAKPPRLRRRIRLLALSAYALLTPKRVLSAKSRTLGLAMVLNRRVLKFRERLNRVSVYNSRGRVRPGILERFDAYIVGSDQVWRWAYGDVPSYLLDAVPKTFAGPRVAYAASFGIDTPTEFDDARTALTRDLASRFTAVSVREESGIELCERLWGVTASRMIDPTMLVTPSTYLDEMGEGRRPAARTLVTYILDWNDERLDILAQLSQRLGLKVHNILPPVLPNVWQIASRPHRHARPSVEEWVNAIAHADFVLTDSYHGTVFSIMFNRPFLTVPNMQRGATRFSTLLDTFGLQHRALFDVLHLESAIHGSIDWEDVNHRIESERNGGLHFLSVTLREATSSNPEHLPPTGQPARVREAE